MVVTSQCSGHRVIGILIGENNVQRYFPRHVKEIELQLDHLRIECGLGRTSGTASRKSPIPGSAFGWSRRIATAIDAALPLLWP